MIKARHTKPGVWFFNLYADFFLKRAFREINIFGENNIPDSSMLIISNHFSWWDGFIQLYLNNRVLHKKFHVMMLEYQLKKFMILNKAGAFSVKKNSRDIIQSLKYSEEILSDKKNLLLIFPQGEIQTLYTEYFKFEKGIEKLMKKEEACLIFNVNLIDYFSYKKPGLNIYYKVYPVNENIGIDTIEKAFNQFATKCKQLQKEV